MNRSLYAKTVKSLLLVLSLGFLFSFEDVKFNIESNYIRVGIDNKGNICSLSDKKTGTDYLPRGHAAPLLSLFKDSAYIDPVKAEYDPGAHEIALEYANGSRAMIRVNSKGDYIRMELLSLKPRNGVQAVVWGPYPTSISQSIGETICVVKDSSFAIGLQALNINTIEGIPDDGDDAGGGSFIDPLPGQEIPDSLKAKIGQPAPVNVNVNGDMPAYVRLYRGSAAVKKPFGSQLQLFSRDRRIPQLLGHGDNVQYVAPIKVDFIGSAIALFGCPALKTLDVIEKIELGEGLPHPMLDGKWIKRSAIPGEAYLLYEGKDPDKGMAYAKDCGFKLIHLGDVFQTWGHFGLKTDRFPNGAESTRQTVSKAEKDGISLGVHTLTMFTGANDLYVSPVPSDSLCTAGSTVLSREVADTGDVIYIKDPAFFRNADKTHTAKIGKELLNYRSVSGDQPWRLLACVRGQYGTKISSHPAGTAVEKLVNNDYSGFYPDINLQDNYARRLAEICNETGIGLMDFDGYGGGSPTGQGCYGAAKFIDLWYKSLKHYVLTCGAGTFHYYWHIYSFMNWGEPWYNNLRESQVNYRIENQRYFERNLMPHMLGWFSLNADYRDEDVEWIQARSAGFNAGYLLRVDEHIEENGFKDQMFSSIRQWQKARNENAFTPAQKIRLQNPKNEFHLEALNNGSWNLYPVNLEPGYVHKFRLTQAGEPVRTQFHVSNSFDEQPIQFYLIAKARENSASDLITHLELEINGYQALSIPVSLKAGDRIFCDGRALWLCNSSWQKIRELPGNNLPRLSKGENTIQIQSEFSGEQAPELLFDFKTVGKPEHVGK
ncbi:MAG: hypothetical protein Q8939_08950 [Bacteroidota bacterium]|nr:hypothetical protein [Bacteroidota bacterium]